jgi:ATP-dependent Clp protease ATP-binding subunit ClpC
MFERITRHSIKALMLAQDESRRLWHASCDTDHLLVGLAGSAGNCANILRSCNMSFGTMRDSVEKSYEMAKRPAWYKVWLNYIPMPLSEDSKAAFEQSFLICHGQSIRTDHILLGVLNVPTSRGAALLNTLGITADKVEAELQDLMQKGICLEE